MGHQACRWLGRSLPSPDIAAAVTALAVACVAEAASEAVRPSSEAVASAAVVASASAAAVASAAVVASATVAACQKEEELQAEAWT